MIKNKILDGKIIFKILKMGSKHFWFPNKFLFYKNYRTILKNCSKKLF